jgi:hypothetical protein
MNLTNAHRNSLITLTPAYLNPLSMIDNNPYRSLRGWILISRLHKRRCFRKIRLGKEKSFFARGEALIERISCIATES